MSHDAIAALSKAISAPVATMTVVTVDSTVQAGEILRAAAAHLEDRPWAELAMPCTLGQAGALLKAAREITALWPPEAGVLFLVDNTPPNRSSEEGVAFWRAMNLQRETWSALNCHLVFLLTLQNQTQLLTVADHLASWIPIKLDARRPGNPRMIQEMQSAESSVLGGRNREEARQRLEELERGLAEALAHDEEADPTAMLRRYYLPMLEAALDANDLARADGIRLAVNPGDVPDADKPRWWPAICQTLLRLYRLEEAKAEAERYLVWAEQSKNIQAEVSAYSTLGEILRTMGGFAGARARFDRALAVAEAAYGADHPFVASTLNNLGSVLQDLGDLAGARAHFERALKIIEATYGPSHPNVAISANNLGSVLQDLGDWTGARALHERALKIDEAVYGPSHPNVANRLNSLGVILWNLGDLAGALAHFEHALAINEASYGKNHPRVATLVNNLGNVLRDLGDLEGGRAYFERALVIDELSYGPNHPNVAIRLRNLGAVLQDLDDLYGARERYARALAIDEVVYGPNHPNVAVNLSHLGSVFYALGDLAGARAYYARALAIYHAFLGESHPETLLAAHNLGTLGE